MKKFWLILLFSFLIFPLGRVQAEQLCTQENPCGSLPLEAQISCLDNARLACKNQSETLTTQINYMNNQIRLTSLKIDSTKATILKLASEISDIENEIGRLEGVLNQRSNLILARIPESYKRASAPQFGMLLFSRDFFDFVSRVKYLVKVQSQDAALLFQVKATQNNYSQRKQLREEKKNQQELAKKELERQGIQLNQQKSEKDALLTATQGNESRYAQLVAAARAQLAAIQQFVVGAGGASLLSNQTVCDGWGCYYNQRDSSWGERIIGSSSEVIANVGCLVTSVSMVLTHYGKKVTPSDVAATLDAFVPGTAYMYFRPWSVNGATVYRTAQSISTGSIDSELSQGHPVIVGVYRGPAHFIVLKSGSNGNYQMNDPFWPGQHDVDFTSRYKFSDITEVDAVRIN